MLSKEYWSRERPVKVSKVVVPLAFVRLPTAYPSGTTLFGGVTGIVLANMVPEKRYDLFERAHQFANGRVVIGVHYPRDVRAGEIAATLIASAFFQTPAFVNDFETARTELRQVLGYPAPLVDQSRGHTAANSPPISGRELIPTPASMSAFDVVDGARSRHRSAIG